MKSTSSRRLIAACAATAALMGLTVSSHAALVTTAFAGTVVDFSQFSGDFAFGTGPVAVGGLVSEDIDWSSSSADAVIGNDVYGLGLNGNWNSGRNGYTGLNNTNASGQYTQFVFGNAVSSVGGFVNYAICEGQQCDPAQDFIIEALDAANNALETYNISALAPISTPYATNDGAFRGIVRANADIYGFRLYNAVHVLDDLTFARADNNVPEPSTLALVGLTLAGLGFSRRRRAA